LWFRCHFIRIGPELESLLGAQLDPPAHWNAYFPAIDELPATYGNRSLVGISIREKAAKNRGYQMTVEDIRAWDERNGKILEGSVVSIRSEWSKEWPNPELAARKEFPCVKFGGPEVSS
jgi:kynurenine formamidase